MGLLNPCEETTTAAAEETTTTVAETTTTAAEETTTTAAAEDTTTTAAGDTTTTAAPCGGLLGENYFQAGQLTNELYLFRIGSPC